MTSSCWACKAYDLDSAMESIAPAVGPDTVIVPMLNGHAHFATLDAKFGAARVAGGLARISGMLGPNGEILHSGASGVSFGERDGKPARASLVELDAACRKAGIDGGLNDNINQDLWDKWIMLSTIAGMCASMRGTIGDIMESEDGAAIVAETLEESRKVAVAEGQAPSDKVVAQPQGHVDGQGLPRPWPRSWATWRRAARPRASRSWATCWRAPASTASPRPTCASPTPICRHTKPAARAVA